MAIGCRLPHRRPICMLNRPVSRGGSGESSKHSHHISIDPADCLQRIGEVSACNLQLQATFRLRQAVPLYLDDMSISMCCSIRTHVCLPPVCNLLGYESFEPEFMQMTTAKYKFQEILIMERTTFQEISKSEQYVPTKWTTVILIK